MSAELVKRLREAVDLNHDTGMMTWKVRPIHHFESASTHSAWNKKFSGKPAFNSPKHGYMQGEFMGKKYGAHRIVWALHYGVWPDHHIDHINEDKSDNSLENLRVANRYENAQNRGAQVNNTSGLKGVWFDNGRGCWRATIRAFGRKYELGYYASKELAHNAYIEKSRELHGEFAYRKARGL